MATALPTVKPNVVARTVADEMILLDLDEGTYFTLNPVGATIWRGLESGASFVELSATIVEQYEVDAVTAETDLQDYLNMLVDEGLLSK